TGNDGDVRSARWRGDHRHRAARCTTDARLIASSEWRRLPEAVCGPGRVPVQPTGENLLTDPQFWALLWTVISAAAGGLVIAFGWLVKKAWPKVRDFVRFVDQWHEIGRASCRERVAIQGVGALW